MDYYEWYVITFEYDCINCETGEITGKNKKRLNIPVRDFTEIYGVVTDFANKRIAYCSGLKILEVLRID